MMKSDTSKSSKSNVTLSVSQQRVFDKLVAFANGKTSDRVFILKGYAGTGKTTLMRFLLADLKKNEVKYQLLASTGRASKVLGNITGEDRDAATYGRTVHSLVYSLTELAGDMKDGKPDEEGHFWLVFGKKLKNPLEGPCLYIVDEASMISDMPATNSAQAKFGSGRTLKELLEYDQDPESRFLFVGDPCQLPPVGQAESPALSADYIKREFGIKVSEAQLTEVFRQSDGSSLLRSSQWFRKHYDSAPETEASYGGGKVWGESLPLGSSCSDSTVHPNRDAMVDAYVNLVKRDGYSDAIFLTYSNANAQMLSSQVRSQLGLAAKGTVAVGDLLLVVQNNIPTCLANGDMVEVIRVNTKVETHTKSNLRFREITVRELVTKKECTTLIIENLLEQKEANLTPRQQSDLFVDFIMRMKSKGIKEKDALFRDNLFQDKYLNALRCSYGYVVTCHKAQGGEWNDVFIDFRRNITLNPTKSSYQWTYTAITRSSRNLHVVRDFFIG